MAKLKVLIAHNHYQQAGGEDIVFEAEKQLLSKHGVDVLEYVETNTRISQMASLGVAMQAIWSRETYNAISDIISMEKPDIAHFHNTFPLISPSAYWACRTRGVSVVQTLHNYRTVCPAATLYRDRRICELCLLWGSPLPGIYHACYHSSRAKTAAVGLMNSLHWLFWTYKHKVNAYIALTQFSRNVFLKAGYPSERIYVKPNFLHDPRVGERKTGEYALYMGRLQPEKGVETLLETWKELAIPLKIVGDGSLRAMVMKYAKDSPFIEYLGFIPNQEVLKLQRQSLFLVFTSEWYEGFPMTILEAFACGVPVLTTDIGSQAEIVKDGYSGIHFRVGNSADLAQKSTWLWNNPGEAARLGRNARNQYEKQYMPERNFHLLMDIYLKASGR